MLIEVNSKSYNHYFPVNPHPFISVPFMELNKEKVNRVVRLIENAEKVYLGLVAGIKDGMLISPFSAPFGGFHYRHSNINIREIDHFLSLLQSYIVSQGLTKIEISLPPDIYDPSFNAKMINAFIRSNFSMATPEITNWIDLIKFTGVFTNVNTRNQYNQAVRFNLSFSQVSKTNEKLAVYELIRQNRERFGRPIHMSFRDLQNTEQLWPVDFFIVRDSEQNNLAAAILYRVHPKIIQTVFWGDNEQGRSKRAMDFFSMNLWNHYKQSGYEFIDLGRSSISGIPDEGLLHFKETHGCTSSLRFTFSWNPSNILMKD